MFLTSTIAGTGTLIQNGSGVTTLVASNSYTGGTIINSGQITVDSPYSLGSTTNTITVNGGSLSLASGATPLAAGQVYLGNGTLTGTYGYLQSASITATNTSAAAVSVDIVGSGSFTQNGSGTTTLSAANTFSGGVTVNNGTVNATYAQYPTAPYISSLGASNNNVIINNGGTLNLGSGAFWVGAVYLGNGTLSATSPTYGLGLLAQGGLFATNTGAALVSEYLNGPWGFVQNGTGTTTLTGNNYFETGSFTINNGTVVAGGGSYVLGQGASTINVKNGATLTNAGFNISVGQINLGSGTISGTGILTETGVTITNNGIALLSDSLAGSGGLTNSGTGTTTISGNNTYTGGNVVNSGTVIVGSSTALGSSANNLTLSGTLSIPGYNETVNTFSGGSGGLLTNSGVGVGTLTMNDSSLSGTFAGTIGGNLVIIQNGSQTETLSGSNSYTGGTVVNSGTLVLSNNYALGAVTNPLTLNGGTLAVGSNNITTGLLGIGNASISGNGTLTPSGINATNSSAITIANSLAGSGTFTQNGAGATTLSGSNSYTGGTVINAGQITVGNTYALGATTNSLTLNGGTFYNNSYNVTIGRMSLGNTAISGSGTITQGGMIATNSASEGIYNSLAGSGTLTQNGSGDIWLYNSNSYTGGTVINNGRLLLDNNYALGAGTNSLAVNNGGTLYNYGYNVSAGQVTLGNGTIENYGGTLSVAGLTATNTGTALISAIIGGSDPSHRTDPAPRLSITTIPLREGYRLTMEQLWPMPLMRSVLQPTPS